MPADREVGADLEVGPAQLVLDLLVALLDPVADRVDPHDLGQPGGRVRAVRLPGAAGTGQVRDQVPGGLVRQGGRIDGRHDQAPDAIRSPPAQLRVGGVPGLGVPVAEAPGHRLPVTGIIRPAPGQRAGRIHRGVRVGGPGPGAAARPQRHHERQPGPGQLAAEPVLVAVGAVRDHRAEHEPRRPRPDRQLRADRQLGPELRVVLPLREVPRRGVRQRVHRVIDALIGPHRGHGHDAVVGLAVPAQILPAHVRGLRAVLAVTRIVDHQHPAAVRRGRRISPQQVQPAGVHRLRLPHRLGQEELQPLHRRQLGPGHRLCPRQGRQRLVPLPRRQQPRQVLAEPPPLRYMGEQVIETGPRTPPADPEQADTLSVWSSLITGLELTRNLLPDYR